VLGDYASSTSLTSAQGLPPRCTKCMRNTGVLHSTTRPVFFLDHPTSAPGLITELSPSSRRSSPSSRCSSPSSRYSSLSSRQALTAPRRALTARRRALAELSPLVAELSLLVAELSPSSQAIRHRALAARRRALAAPRRALAARTTSPAMLGDWSSTHSLSHTTEHVILLDHAR
jgi:hypothetical protein